MPVLVKKKRRMTERHENAPVGAMLPCWATDKKPAHASQHKPRFSSDGAAAARREQGDLFRRRRRRTVWLVVCKRSRAAVKGWRLRGLDPRRDELANWFLRSAAPFKQNWCRKMEIHK